MNMEFGNWFLESHNDTMQQNIVHSTYTYDK